MALITQNSFDVPAVPPQVSISASLKITVAGRLVVPSKDEMSENIKKLLGAVPPRRACRPIGAGGLTVRRPTRGVG